LCVVEGQLATLEAVQIRGVGNIPQQLFTVAFYKCCCKEGKQSHTYASQVIEELLLLTGTLIDPKIIKEQRIEQQLPRFHLTVEEALFFLSLWTEHLT
jgi:hypothetical protein